jgi:N-acetylmuramoyl-L-alanine amidase
VRFSWFFWSLLSFFLLSLPAEAAKLLFWRFEAEQNRLVFTTDERVQPKAQLITNPTRVVIDLPGVVLGRPSVTQTFSGKISSIRIGQFDSETTRLVIELIPGYTVNPQEVKIRGLSPTQWTVDLPTPQPIESTTSPSLPPPSPPPNRVSRPSPPPTPPQESSGETADFQVTRNGLFVRLERNGDERKVRIKRSRDRQKINIELPGATLVPSLVGKTLTVNDYGVSEIAFAQESGRAELTLRVDRESPDWQALYSRFGGLVLLPRGGFSDRGTSPSTSAPPTISSGTKATIQSLDLASNNTQLTIRSDAPIQGTGRWNARQGVYEIRIPQARIADSFRGPRLGSNSPVYQVRIVPEEQDGVLITLQPHLGFQIGELSQPSPQVLVLDTRSLRTSRSSGSEVTQIPVPPPRSAPPPLVEPPPRPLPASPRSRQGKTLVVIDPGHGGQDPGAIGIGGLQEKDVILPISLEVARYLEQRGVEVILTRSSDFFVSLQGRTDLSNRAEADLFVSIHANSMGMSRPDVNGLEVYYLGNRTLADTIHRNIIRSLDIRDRGVRRARFFVLRTAKMPSTLVEVGFVTGSEDAPKLRNANYQKRMAEAIAQGILEYIRQNL